MDGAKRFRIAAEEANRNRLKTGWRYPPELRAQAVEIFEQQRQPLNCVALALGVTSVTLARWLEGAGSQPSPEFRQVQVAADLELESGGLKVTSPGGLQIEGLRFREVVELLRLWG